MQKILIVCVLFVFVSVPVAMARPGHRLDSTTNSCRDFSQGDLEWGSRAWGDGGQAFQSNCKSCHFRGNDEGAPFLWAESKSSRGWNRVFAEKKVPCAKDGSWDSLSKDQLLKLNDYLFRFGLNSGDAFDSA